MPSAKLFTSGRSQAVRLPKAFRFEGVQEASIERDGGAVILRPLKRPSIEELIAALDEFEPGFQIEREQPPEQTRQELGQ